MSKIKNSWFPAYKFSKDINCNRDWQIGVSSWKCKDYLTGSTINPFTTVFWSRIFNNASISLDTYNEVVKNKDPKILEKMKSIGLPLDIKF